jgi:hypothetical protein
MLLHQNVTSLMKLNWCLIKFASDNYKVIKLSDGSESPAVVNRKEHKRVSCYSHAAGGPLKKQAAVSCNETVVPSVITLPPAVDNYEIIIFNVRNWTSFPFRIFRTILQYFI